MKTWIEGENGNRASVERWGSVEAAKASLETLKNCSHCSDCSHCFCCSRCSDCSDCSRCSDCSGCSRCSDCSGCSRCSDCSREEKISVGVATFNIPVIPDIHKAVYDAASKPYALNMGAWHTCETTHCRAGWVVHLAGNAGKELEMQTSTLFAAMQIYDASDPSNPVSPVRFFEENEVAMADMKRMAELS